MCTLVASYSYSWQCLAFLRLCHRGTSHKRIRLPKMHVSEAVNVCVIINYNRLSHLVIGIIGDVDPGRREVAGAGAAGSLLGHKVFWVEPHSNPALITAALPVVV